MYLGAETCRGVRMYVSHVNCMYRVRRNYRRFSLRHNLSMKCRKIVKFGPITHSERNIWSCSGVPKWIPARSMGWSCSGHRQHLMLLATPVTRPDCVISSCGVSSRTILRPTTSKDTTRIAESASTPHSGTAHKTCLRGFGGNGSIAWTSAVSHGGRTSNAFKVTMKLQTFLFQMVATSCISV